MCVDTYWREDEWRREREREKWANRSKEMRENGSIMDVHTRQLKEAAREIVKVRTQTANKLWLGPSRWQLLFLSILPSKSIDGQPIRSPPVLLADVFRRNLPVVIVVDDLYRDAKKKMTKRRPTICLPLFFISSCNEIDLDLNRTGHDAVWQPIVRFDLDIRR